MQASLEMYKCERVPGDCCSREAVSRYGITATGEATFGFSAQPRNTRRSLRASPTHMPPRVAGSLRQASSPLSRALGSSASARSRYSSDRLSNSLRTSYPGPSGLDGGHRVAGDHFRPFAAVRRLRGLKCDDGRSGSDLPECLPLDLKICNSALRSPFPIADVRCLCDQPKDEQHTRDRGRTR